MAPRKILLAGDPISYEAPAAASITPGMLLMRTSAGKVQAHNAAAGVAQSLFAREKELTGGGIDTAYATNDNTRFYNCRKGDQVYAFLVDEGNVAIGAVLESAGDGSLRATTHGTGSATAAAAWPIAVALEAVNNTGGTGMVRIKVEIL